MILSARLPRLVKLYIKCKKWFRPFLHLFFCQKQADFRKKVGKKGEIVARKYKYIDFEDRKLIARLWSIGTPAQVIAEEIGTNPATISRELRRGYTGKNGRNQRPAYNPVIAQKAVTAGIARRGNRPKGRREKINLQGGFDGDAI